VNVPAGFEALKDRRNFDSGGGLVVSGIVTKGTCRACCIMDISEGGGLLFQKLQVGTRALYSRGETGCSCGLGDGKLGQRVEFSEKASNTRVSLKGGYGNRHRLEIAICCQAEASMLSTVRLCCLAMFSVRFRPGPS